MPVSSQEIKIKEEKKKSTSTYTLKSALSGLWLTTFSSSHGFAVQMNSELHLCHTVSLK